VHVYSDKPLPMDVDTIVYFVIQSWQISVGGVIYVSHHDNSVQWLTKK